MINEAETFVYRNRLASLIKMTQSYFRRFDNSPPFSRQITQATLSGIKPT
jgi:hypothetical protein